MKGIILAGGTGSRLMPLTKVTNKHLLPVYNKPMIYYPLHNLIEAGIQDILIVSGPNHSDHFSQLLGCGEAFGVSFSYQVQEKAGGIAEALSLAQNFVNGDNMAVMLGDSIFDDTFSTSIANFTNGAHIFLKEVHDAERFGVATVEGQHVVKIIEKPSKPETNLAVTGFYLYDNTVFEKISTLVPSARNELEITDVNNMYIKTTNMKWSFVEGYWTDAGTIESLYNASHYMRNKELQTNNA